MRRGPLPLSARVARRAGGPSLNKTCNLGFYTPKGGNTGIIYSRSVLRSETVCLIDTCSTWGFKLHVVDLA